jgi:hypothetical protein
MPAFAYTADAEFQCLSFRAAALDEQRERLQPSEGY